MANLSITIGPLSRSRTADDARATEVVTQYAAAIGATGTAAQRLDAVLLSLERHMREVAKRHRRNVAQAEANAALAAELAELYWGEPEPSGGV